MRSALASTLAFTLAVGSGSAISLRANTAVAAPAESPEQLYQEGRKAFRVGNYEEAVAKFERAYELSDNAVLLFNLGLAYQKWFGVSKDINHLRKAKAVFQNFVLEAQRDPENIGDPADAEEAMKKVEAELGPLEEAEAERKRKEAEAAAKQKEESREKGGTTAPVRPTGPDPGKKLRLAGVVLMGVGGAAVLGGAVLGVVFGLKGKEFKEELASIRNDQDAMNCDGGSPGPDCGSLNAQEDTTIDNGRKANILTAVSLGVIAGVGVLALAAGGGVFAVGNSRTKAWQEGKVVRSLRLSPMAGRRFGGLTLTGRF